MNIAALLLPLERLALTVWLGATWSIGYLVAPVLFMQLDDRRVAGRLAGEMFDLVHLIGFICGPLLLLLALHSYRQAIFKAWRVWLLLLMIGLIAVIEFYIRPQMVALKAQDLFSSPLLAAEFAKLHGASSICYLINSLAGLALVIAGVRKPG